MNKSHEVRIGRIKLSNKRPLALISGPCVIVDEKFCLDCARQLKKITSRQNIPFIFKASFDKANRSSGESYRGPGINNGLEILQKIKQDLSLPVLSDVHCRTQLPKAAVVLDVIQIPAFLCRQTDLLVTAAKTGRPLNIKKGQFLAPWDMENIIKKVASTGNKNIIITERGSSFGYNNLVSDMRSLKILQEYGYPVFFDGTHSVQLPGAAGNSSGGERRFVSALSRAAVAVGCAGLFLEVHPEPDKALCDGPNTIDFQELEKLLTQVKKIDRIIKRSGRS
ncbi:MAG: 3-deoxy-8-phosphooctulonate synthase [Candidatus Omnitrophota bacterium]